MNKKIPSSKKNIKKFLTTGSAGLVFGGSMFFASPTNTNAVVSNYTVPNTLPFPYVADCTNCNNTVGPKKMVTSTPTTCNHASGIVNGHFSAIPSINTITESIDLYSHASHSSSGSGGGGGWC